MRVRCLDNVTAIGIMTTGDNIFYCGKIISVWDDLKNKLSVELCDFISGARITTEVFNAPDLNEALEGFRFQDFVLTYDYERSFREHGFELFKVI